jgi:SAM-dependent methyltransferase
MKSKIDLLTDEALKYPSKKILDIGYAQTPNSALGKNGAEVYGIDIVSAPAENYKETYVCDLNTTKLPFKDGEIDLVAMGCTLAHVANPLKVLAEVNRILKPEGILIISSPNPNYYWETVLNVFYNTFKNRVSEAKHIEHFFEFSRYNMRTIGERSGFTLVNEVGYLFWLVKTKIRFNPISRPGMAYEIIYTFKKSGVPESYATFEDERGIHKVNTDLFS